MSNAKDSIEEKPKKFPSSIDISALKVYNHSLVAVMPISATIPSEVRLIPARAGLNAVSALR